MTARLRGIHLHDATPPAAPGGKGKAHLPIGAGILDLNILFAALAERRFSGPVVLEVKSEFSESTARVLDIVQSISGGQSH